VSDPSSSAGGGGKHLAPGVGVKGSWLLCTGARPLPAPCLFLLTSRLVFGAFAELSRSGFSSITSLVFAIMMAAAVPLGAGVGPQGVNEEEVDNEASFRRGDADEAMVAVGVYTKTELKAAKLRKLPDPNLELVKAGLVKAEVTGKRDVESPKTAEPKACCCRMSPRTFQRAKS